jgi:hypothetical protein
MLAVQNHGIRHGGGDHCLLSFGGRPRWRNLLFVLLLLLFRRLFLLFLPARALLAARLAQRARRVDDAFEDEASVERHFDAGEAREMVFCSALGGAKQAERGRPRLGALWQDRGRRRRPGLRCHTQQRARQR